MQTLHRYIRFIRRWLTPRSRARYLCGMAAALLIHVMTVLLPIVQRNTFDKISDTGALLRWSLLLLLCGVLLGCLHLISAVLKRKLNVRIQQDLQLRLIANGIESSNAVIEMRGAGAYIGAVYGDCEQISNILSAMSPWLAFLGLIQIGAVLAITLSWTWVFAASVLPTYAAAAAVTVLCARISRPEFKKFREILSKINPKLLEALENRVSVLGYRSAASYTGDIRALFSQRDRHVLRFSTAEEVSTAAVGWCALISQVLLLVLSAYQIAAGEMGLGELVALLAYAGLGFSPIAQIKSAYGELTQFAVLEDRIKDKLPRADKKILSEISPYTFTDCTVSYQENGSVKLVLRNVTHTFQGITGVVGLSGSGKTSLIKTMLGQVSPQEGSCRIGGLDAGECSLQSLLALVRYYPQSPEIFDDTAAFNITLGKKPVSREDFRRLVGEKAAAIARSAHDSGMLEALCGEVRQKLNVESGELARGAVLHAAEDPAACRLFAAALLNYDCYIEEKYAEILRALELDRLADRPLGMRGGGISGGEKNRVALARFLLPEGASFFILDEPFVNIDILSMKKCMEVFEKFCPCENGLIVSHNLQVITSLCPSILVVEEGSAPVLGTHETLMEENALYRRLYEEFQAFHSGQA